MYKTSLVSIVVVFCVSATWAQQPAPLPNGIELTGTYYCNKSLNINHTSRQPVIDLEYDKTTGKITGTIKNQNTPFIYLMTKSNITRSKRGVFFWAADKTNKIAYPLLTEPMYLLKDGKLASAPVRKIKGGTDYEVPGDAKNDIILFCKHLPKGTNPNMETIAKEIGDIATAAWGDFFGMPK